MLRWKKRTANPFNYHFPSWQNVQGSTTHAAITPGLSVFVAWVWFLCLCRRGASTFKPGAVGFLASHVAAARTDCSTPVWAAFQQRFQAASPVRRPNEQLQLSKAGRWRRSQQTSSTTGETHTVTHTCTHTHKYTHSVGQQRQVEELDVFLRCKTDKHLLEAGRQRSRMEKKGTKWKISWLAHFTTVALPRKKKARLPPPASPILD